MSTNVDRMIYVAADVCFLYIQKLYIVYFSNIFINNNAIFHSILQLCKISGPIFHIQKGSQMNLYYRFI